MELFYFILLILISCDLSAAVSSSICSKGLVKTLLPLSTNSGAESYCSVSYPLPPCTTTIHAEQKRASTTATKTTTTKTKKTTTTTTLASAVSSLSSVLSVLGTSYPASVLSSYTASANIILGEFCTCIQTPTCITVTKTKTTKSSTTKKTTTKSTATTLSTSTSTTPTTNSITTSPSTTATSTTTAISTVSTSITTISTSTTSATSTASTTSTTSITSTTLTTSASGALSTFAIQEPADRDAYCYCPDDNDDGNQPRTDFPYIDFGPDVATNFTLNGGTLTTVNFGLIFGTLNDGDPLVRVYTPADAPANFSAASCSIDWSTTIISCSDSVGSDFFMCVNDNLEPNRPLLCLGQAGNNYSSYGYTEVYAPSNILAVAPPEYVCC